MDPQKCQKKNSYKNMMYEQQIAHLPAKDVDALKDIIETRLKPKKYALIIHDKDMNEQGQPAEAHVHVMLTFENARSINNIAKLLGDKPQYLEAWKGEAKNGFAYLIHATDNARAKYQYDASEVKANFDYAAMMQTIAKEVKKANTVKDASAVRTLLDLLYMGAITKEEVERQLSGSQFGRVHKQIEDVWAKRLQHLAEEWRKDMVVNGKIVTVIWIYGIAGTGKTSLAKDHAKKANQPFYMSGSSRDIFQRYAGEHTLILDELRPNDIPYHDLLRITDPFGINETVMAPSRYNDKALACDLILITSPYDPVAFHAEIFGEKASAKIDSLGQLVRRLSLVIQMTDAEIFAAEYDRSTGRYAPNKATARPNPYSSASRPIPSVSAVDIYNSIFD